MDPDATDPASTFRALHRAVAAVAGARLFTVTRIDRAAGLARRIHSSDPAAYPLSGTKPIRPDAWTAQVIEQGRPFVANSVAEFAVHFPDHALIESLGCRSALNLPVAAGGAIIATVNILDDADRFTPQVVAGVQAILSDCHDDLVAAVGASPFG